MHKCDNCRKIWAYAQLNGIADLMERIEPGGEVPSGECPDCGALCYPTDDDDGYEPIKLR